MRFTGHKESPGFLIFRIRTRRNYPRGKRQAWYPFTLTSKRAAGLLVLIFFLSDAFDKK
jgi:hypothetical protein